MILMKQKYIPKTMDWTYDHWTIDVTFKEQFYDLTSPCYSVTTLQPRPPDQIVHKCNE